MKILGALFIGGVIIYLFIISFVYLWWFWLFLLGVFLLMLSGEKKKEKEKNTDKENFIDENKQVAEENVDEITEDGLDDFQNELIKDYGLDKDVAERVEEIMDKYGVDVDEAIEIEEEE